MYANTGYLNLPEINLTDLTTSLKINSCGVYRLLSLPSMSTIRPSGRSDYQLLYVASGKAWFTFDQAPIEVSEGNLILYRPYICQKYTYYLEDKPQVFWVHFTGHEAEALLEHSGFSQNHILYTGVSSNYQDLFLCMIRELQFPRPYCEELLPLLFRQLLVSIRRQATESVRKGSQMQKEMERAIHFFNENFSKDIEITDYAKNQHMSTCWFIRSFKQYVGMPPGQYLIAIRMNKAKELLESTNYTIGEISAIVGYDNPFYFSRIFKKQTGLPPAVYRKNLPSTSLRK